MAEFHDLDMTPLLAKHMLEREIEHIRELREADLRFNEERDRRYTEVDAARDRALEAALAAVHEANKLAQANAEKWRENANEWRGAMSDRDRELPSRREVETLVSGLTARVDLIEAHEERAGGKREGIGMSAGVLVGGLGALATLMTVVVVVVNLLTSG